jgi:hypothetical protein
MLNAHLVVCMKIDLARRSTNDGGHSIHRRNRLRVPLIIAVAATLVGCSREPPYQAIPQSRAEERQCADSNTAAACQPAELTSFQLTPTETKHKTRPPPDRVSNRTGHIVTKKAGPILIGVKTEPPSSLSAQKPKSKIAAVSSGATELPTVGLASNAVSRTIQEQVAAAIAVAKRSTVATLAAANDLEPVDDTPPNKREVLVAIVVARPEITSVRDLEGKDVAMDEEYLESRNDILLGFVLAGAHPNQFSAGHTTAINRLLNKEVPAAVLALVSSDSADGFPDIAGFKVFQVPLLLRSPAGNRDKPKRSE